MDFSIIEAGFDSTIRSTIWTGRPLRAAATPYIRNWEVNRRNELEELLAKGIIPIDYEMKSLRGADDVPEEVMQQSEMRYVVSIFLHGALWLIFLIGQWALHAVSSTMASNLLLR